jgi:hypothetical protein
VNTHPEAVPFTEDEVAPGHYEGLWVDDVE